MQIKKSGDQPDTTHRITLSFSESTYEALRAQSETLGYSIAGVARQVIDRGLAAGLLYADTPSPQGAAVVNATLMEQYCQLSAKLSRSYEERIEGLIDHLDLKDQRIAQMQQALEEYAETITKQVRDIEWQERKARLLKRLES